MFSADRYTYGLPHCRVLTAKEEGSEQEPIKEDPSSPVYTLTLTGQVSQEEKEIQIVTLFSFSALVYVVASS